MLEVINLECIRGERRLFSGVNCQLQSGELLYLQGTNGSGKTSLLSVLCGLTQAAAGEVRWRGESILRQEYREELCYLGHLNAIKEEFTPLENLLISARLSNQPLTEDQALDALDFIGLAGRADLACRYLSQGQKRRVALARLVHEKRALWVLDEPYVALDTAGVERVAGLIGRHLQQGGLVVLTTHQKVAIPQAVIRELWLSEIPSAGQPDLC